MSVDFGVRALSYAELLEAFKKGTQIDFVRDKDPSFMQAEIADAIPIEGGVQVVMAWAIQQVPGKSTIQRLSVDEPIVIRFNNVLATRTGVGIHYASCAPHWGQGMLKPPDNPYRLRDLSVLEGSAQ